MITALLLTGLATADDWAWRSAFGVQRDPDPHGAFDLGARNGAFSAQLLTDTIDVRWAPERDRGRWWVAGRGEFAFAQLLPFPWTDGAPDPSRGLAASYIGAEGGGLWYLPRGFYAGGQAMARYYTFGPREFTAIDIPDPRLVATPEAVLGYWQESLQAWLRAGANLGPALASPHAALEAKYRPGWTVGPRAELRAGWGLNQDYLTATRLGGLNPYVVPLGGAGWAEFWVEDYAVGRLGPEGRLPLAGGTLALSGVADLAAFRTYEADEQTAIGFAAIAEWRRERWLVETSWGYAPWIERQPGVSPMAAWLWVGFDFP